MEGSNCGFILPDAADLVIGNFSNTNITTHLGGLWRVFLHLIVTRHQEEQNVYIPQAIKGYDIGH
jgi:hypothetical protein